MERRTVQTFTVEADTYGVASLKAMAAAEAAGFGIPRVIAWREVAAHTIEVTIEEFGF